MPTLISDGILLVFILEDWQIDFHMAFWLPAASAMVCTPGAPRSIGLWWHWWGSWHWTSVTLKPMIQWRWRCLGWCSPWVSSHLATVPATLWYPVLVMVWHPDEYAEAPPHIHQHSGAFLPVGLSWLWNLNSSNAGRWEWQCPGPQATVYCLVMAWAFNHWLYYRLNALALSRACLPNQLMAPDSVNMVSCVSPKLSPSPRDCLL